MTTRMLTEGEITLARTVFGDSVDYHRVRILDKRLGGPLHAQGALKTIGSRIYAYRLYERDFSQSSLYMQSVFLHEMAHVWQFQHRLIFSASLADIWNAVSCTAKAYQYILSDKKDLLNYGIEQQASIIEDYFVLKTDKPFWFSDTCRNKGSLEEKTRLYETVLSRFLKNPDYPGKFPNPFRKNPPAL